MKKKILALLMVATMALGLTACGGQYGGRGPLPGAGLVRREERP